MRQFASRFSAGRHHIASRQQAKRYNALNKKEGEAALLEQNHVIPKQLLLLKSLVAVLVTKSPRIQKQHNVIFNPFEMDHLVTL